MKKLAILASGKGSNAQRLLQKAKKLEHLSIELIITDQKNAGVIKIAKMYSVPCFVVPSENIEKEVHEQNILQRLKEFNIDWVLLAGYMRVLSPVFLKKFYDTSLHLNRVINIHPSLLPMHRGLNAFQKAFEDKSITKSGITIHFVDEGIDTGKIILQKEFSKEPNDNLEDFIRRGQMLEHELYPQVLEKINTNTLENI